MHTALVIYALHLLFRLNRAYLPSVKYMDLFAHPIVAILAQNVAFVAGSVLAVLLVLTVIQEDLLTAHNVLTFITLLGEPQGTSRPLSSYSLPSPPLSLPPLTLLSLISSPLSPLSLTSLSLLLILPLVFLFSIKQVSLSLHAECSYQMR